MTLTTHDDSAPDIEASPQPQCFHLRTRLDIETGRLVCQRCGQAFLAELRAWCESPEAKLSAGQPFKPITKFLTRT